jgi:hypothetical protein
MSLGYTFVATPKCTCQVSAEVLIVLQFHFHIPYDSFFSRTQQSRVFFTLFICCLCKLQSACCDHNLQCLCDSAVCCFVSNQNEEMWQRMACRIQAVHQGTCCTCDNRNVIPHVVGALGCNEMRQKCVPGVTVSALCARHLILLL